MSKHAPKSLICAVAAAAALVVAPAADAAPKAKALVVDAPTAIDAGSQAAVTVTAVGKKGKAVKRFKGKVALTSTDPAAKLPATYKFSKADKGRHTFEVTLGSAGQQTVNASAKVKRKRISGSRAVTVTGTGGGGNPGGNPSTDPGSTALASIELSVPANVGAGEEFQATVTGFNSSGASLGDVTAQATIKAGRQDCDATGCVIERAGRIAVTATVGSLTDEAAVDVAPGAPSSLELSGPETVAANATIVPHLDFVDRWGNPPAEPVAISISPDGACTAGGCKATKAGPHVITAAGGGLSDTLDVNVVPGPLAELQVNAPSSAQAGTTFGVSATGFDAWGNSRGNVTSATEFAVDGGGCNGSGCWSTVAGGSKAIVGTASGVTGSARIEITPGALYSLQVTPQTNERIAPAVPNVSNADYQGRMITTMSYRATGADVYGNSKGDVTSLAAFTIANANCSASTCAGTTPGNRPVIAKIGGVTGVFNQVVAPYEDAYWMTCRGENYDVNGQLDDGCEIVQYKAGHGTEATAIDLGSKSCSDSASQTHISGSIQHDGRTHTGEIPGFDPVAGSAGTVYKLRATGGACVNDLQLGFETFFGADDGGDCYMVSVRTNRNFDRAWTDGKGTTGIVRGSGYYSDNTDIYVEVRWTCGKQQKPESTNYSLDFHL